MFLPQVDVSNRTLDIDLTNFVDNGEWTLVDTRVQRNVIYYPCCPEPFPDVTFYIQMRRRVLYYFLNVIIPCMLLSALTLTGFCLPPDSGEKVTLGLTVLLAFSVFMLLIAENMPPTSEYVPLIGKLPSSSLTTCSPILVYSQESPVVSINYADIDITVVCAVINQTGSLSMMQ